MRSTHPLLLLGALALVGSLLAQDVAADPLLKGKKYYFGTHPARTTVTFVSDADLETIHGVTHIIGGSVSVDATGKSATGGMRVAVKDMRTGITLRDEHLQSDAWLDVKKFPFIRLQLVSAVERKDGKTWDYTANITIKGVTKKFTGTARVRAIPDRIGKILGKGSWARVRTKFEVTLSDFGIKIPQMIGAKVSKTWQVGVDAYGTTTPPPAKKKKRK